jgi:hypothetical protein
VILEGDWVVVGLMGKADSWGWYVESFILLTAFGLSRSIGDPNAGKFMAHEPPGIGDLSYAWDNVGYVFGFGHSATLPEATTQWRKAKFCRTRVWQLDGTINSRSLRLSTAMLQEVLANNEVRAESCLLKDHANSLNPINLIGSAYFNNLILKIIRLLIGRKHETTWHRHRMKPFHHPTAFHNPHLQCYSLTDDPKSIMHYVNLINNAHGSKVVRDSLLSGMIVTCRKTFWSSWLWSGNLLMVYLSCRSKFVILETIGI